MNIFFRYLYNKYFPGGPKWRPLVAVYYLTYNCPLRCIYCSDGAGTPYHSLGDTSKTASEAIGILAAIRRACDSIIITGGEPACHPEFASVLRQLKELKFAEVILTTKGDGLEGLEEEINGCVTRLVVSIDTMDPEKAREIHNNSGPVLENTLKNVKHLAKLPGRRFEIYISSVVGTFNLEDLPEVFEFSQQIGVWYAAQPQLKGVKAPLDLIADKRYPAFYDLLIGKKRAGGRVFGPINYLTLLRNFSKFDCYPFTMVVVAPDGEVFYPCLEIGHRIGKIQEAPGIDALRRAGMERFGQKPLCDNRCHSACAAEYAVFMRHPLDAIAELFEKKTVL